MKHYGDLSQYCSDCMKVYDVMLADLPNGFEVRMNPEDVDWADRRVWYHAGSLGWWDDCPSDVMVHVGHKDTSMWLAGTDNRRALYTVRVVGKMPKRLIKDKVDDWGEYSSGYVNAWEYPGRVSLYLPKSRLELVDKVEI